MKNTEAYQERFLNRPRIDALFSRYADAPIIQVVAEGGYGKTLAVHAYLQQSGDAAIWVDLTESDNNPAHLWSNISYALSLVNPQLAMKILEMEFPEDELRMQRLIQAIESLRERNRLVAVFDDFHLIQNPIILRFLENSHQFLPSICRILIRRPNPNGSDCLLSSEYVQMISQNDLLFSLEETKCFFAMKGVDLPIRAIQAIQEATDGWPLALNVLVFSMYRKAIGLDFALNLMKENLFPVISQAIFEQLSIEMQHIMIRLSLVSDLPQNFYLTLDWAKPLVHHPQFVSFAWINAVTGQFQIHPLFGVFLKTLWESLTEEDVHTTYRQAAHWCSQNGFFFEAMRYYVKLADCGSIVNLLQRKDDLLVKHFHYYIDLIETLVLPEDTIDPNELLLRDCLLPGMMMSVGRWTDAQRHVERVIARWEGVEHPLQAITLHLAYNIRGFTIAFSGLKADWSLISQSFERSYEHFSAIKPPFVANKKNDFEIALPPFACAVPLDTERAELDNYLARLQSISYLAEMGYDRIAGYEHLAACEVAFYANQLEEAKRQGDLVMIKVSGSMHSEIEALCMYYLVRIAFMEGDKKNVLAMVQKIQHRVEQTDAFNRSLQDEFTLGWIFAQAGIPQKIPPWLITKYNQGLPGSIWAARESLIRAKCFLSVGEYQDALFCLRLPAGVKLPQKFLFGELGRCIMNGVALFKLGDPAGAKKEMDAAWKYSNKGEFETLFLEYGTNMRDVAAAALEDPDCPAPYAFLKSIMSRVRVYAKRTAVIGDALRRQYGIEKEIMISARERQILNDLYYGLSRTEIAETRYLSINTVKTNIQSLYNKLDANNIADALRIGIQRGLIAVE
jgi:LuxR family maltose regulon positive regulatory protein